MAISSSSYATILLSYGGLGLVIGTQKNIASTGVFVRVVCAINHSFKKFPSEPSTIST
jgi:hypothetical protein